MTRTLKRLCLLTLTAAVAACSSTPPPPDWQMAARISLDRAAQAWLQGSDRAAEAEMQRARRELRSTGQPALLARAELHHCAARVAALQPGACPAFEALALDAAPADQAYARHLQGQASDADRALLPPAQRQPLADVADPLSRLVAAGVRLQTGHITPAEVALAVDTASAQGWRRPLLAWLGVQRDRALQAGETAEAARLQRRMDLATAH